MAIDKGLFGFNDVMNQFYSYKPDKNDATGNAMKNSFAANMVQSGFDNHMAKDMASHQTGLSQSTMTHAADLELRNTSTLMKQEHGYNMATMGAASGYQNEFADRDVGRDVTKMGAAGEQSRENIKATGVQNQIQSVVEGEQDRLSDTNRYSVAGAETRATDSNRIQQEGAQNRGLVETQGKVQQAVEKTKAYEKRATDTNQIRTTGQENRENVRTTGDETRKNYETQGSEQRKTLSHGADIDTRKIKFQKQSANDAARGF
jgi:hypothetical protein